MTVNSQPCFHVWDTDGNYYEFGCTTDSLQYDTNSSGTRTNYRWDLDKVIPANEGPTAASRTMAVSYVHDTTTGGGHTTIRDSAIKQIVYGGSQPAGTVDFFYKGPTAYTDGNGVQWITAYGKNEGGCTPPDGLSTTERCDDPADRSGGLQNPLVMSTLSLETVKSYVGTDSSASHLDYSYSFSYQDTPFVDCTDSVSLSPAYCAGEHLLTGITPTVYQNGTGHQLPGITFSYTPTRQNSYSDTTQTVGGNAFHAVTNWSYLQSYFDLASGVGATIQYHTAWNNSNGTPLNSDGDNRYDALFCDWHPSLCTQAPFAPMDQKMWTVQVVTSITSSGQDSSSSSLSPDTTSYDYWLQKTAGSCPADSSGLTDCVGDGWIPNGDGDWQDYYHGEFRGFATVLITSPAGDLTVDKYASTEGWFTADSDAGNYTAGQLYEEDHYQGQTIDGAKLFDTTTTSYAGTSGTHTSCSSTFTKAPYTACEVIALSTRTTDYEQSGSGNANAPWTQVDDTYDDYTTSGGLGDHHQSPATGSYHNLQQEVTSSSNAPTLTQKWTYDTTSTTVSGTTYYNVDQVASSQLVDAAGHIWNCENSTYDQGTASGVPTPAAGWPTTETSYSDCAHQSGTALQSYTGYDSNGNVVAAVDGVGAATPSLYSSAGCTLSTAPSFFPTGSWSGSHYTSCSAYDATSALLTDAWNALGQHSSITYDATQGMAPVKTTDVNGQATTTAYSYDSAGNSTVSESDPGEAGSSTGQSTLTSTCTASSTLPCLEVDSVASQYSSATTRTFYDSLGRSVETLTPGPDSAHTTVTFTVYDDQAHSVFASVPFVVASRSTWLDPNGATDDAGATPGGTSTTVDALGRTVSATDPLGNISSASYGLGTSGVSGDSATYAITTGTDANQHVAVTYSDALGRTIYVVQESGTAGGTLTPVERTSSQYNALSEPTSVTVTDLAPQSGQSVTSVTTTATYDDLGRLTSLNDPDRGSHTYSYDADGREVADVSGSHTLGDSYDLLGRLGCLQDATPTEDAHGACTSGAHPFVQNTYDADPSGVSWGSTNYAVGRLTQSVATNYLPAPDNTEGIVTENYQYDQRGRPITERMQISTSGGTLAFPSFPLYQQTLAYNDADQLTTTQTSVGGQSGYTFTQSYDSTSGVLNGLSNTSTGAPTLDALSYNARALASAITYKDSSGATLATQNLQYDGDLRPTSASTGWQSGGTIYSDAVSYDAVGNVTSRTTTQAAVSGVSGSGGSEVQNYCYDEQNRLVWASNSVAAQPTAGQSCGTTALQGQLGGSYTASYVYTHLGQLWQGPLNGSGTQEQYLYCNSSHPHQVTALAALSASPTCSSPGTTDYSASYDNWGNMTARSYPATTSGTLSYDAQDQLLRWSATTASNNEEEWYFYDADGNRVLRRSATTDLSGNPATAAATITVYPFGLEEHAYQYSGSGSSLTNTGNTYYYTLGGNLLGMLSGTTTPSTDFLLTDTLGSVVASISNTAGSAAVLGNQEYGPYGNQRYSAGTLGTARGFTGQYSDDLTGLDDYGARYYDPVVGRFLSADTVSGNLDGQDPYAYVDGNPTTFTDPSGDWRYDPSTGQAQLPTPGAPIVPYSGPVAYQPSPLQALTTPHGSSGEKPPVPTVKQQISSYVRHVVAVSHPKSSDNSCRNWSECNAVKVQAVSHHQFDVHVKEYTPLPACGPLSFCGVALAPFDLHVRGSGMQTHSFCVGNAFACLMEELLGGRAKGQEESYDPGFGCSFTAATPVTTAQGKQPIGKLKPGEKVWAYNPRTHKMEWQPILHVWIDKDKDLVNLTITTPAHSQPGKLLKATSEVVHTNKKHPFLTIEKGFLPVGQIKVGMHVLRADGRIGTITGYQLVPGVMTMYNLEVAQDHTFTVGAGQWVVHNDCQPTRLQMFNQAKRDLGIPTSASPSRQGWVNRFGSNGEPQRVYEFIVDGERMYIIAHQFDPNGRGPHFHVAGLKYPGQDLFVDGEKYINLGKQFPDLYQAHYPETYKGFR